MFVRTPRVEASLGVDVPGWGLNRVDILTGPNGSGKTDLLSSLAKWPLGYSAKKNVIEVRYKATDILEFEPEQPLRVISQTFSPFSRFPKSNIEEFSLRKLLELKAPDIDPHITDYLCLGLHSSSNSVGKSLSKRMLEAAVLRISEAPKSVPVIFQLLREIGFQERLVLTYKPSGFLRDAISLKGDNTDRARFIQEHIQQGFLSEKTSKQISALIDEVNGFDGYGFQHSIEAALEALSQFYNEEKMLFKLDLSAYERRASWDFAAYQSLALFRHLKLISFSGCDLYLQVDRSPLDVANASSGQQQMLCSIIGLATAMKDQSLVLIDEPELSLHPRWQMMYLQYVQAALRNFEGCHVLIATHSPLITQTGIEMGVGVVQVGSTEGDGHLEPSAASVDEALVTVFETPVKGSVYLANQLFSAVADAESDDPRAKRLAKQELLKLQSIYADKQVGDSESVGLIKDALEMFKSEGGGNA